MQAGKEFRVVVADSRPHYEGRAMLSKLLAHGIPCTYLQLNALCYSMQARSESLRYMPDGIYFSIQYALSAKATGSLTMAFQQLFSQHRAGCIL